MGKTWMEMSRRRDLWTMAGLAWAFLAVPLVVVANNVDPDLGRVLLAIAVGPIIIGGIGVLAIAAVAPFFLRKPSVRLVAVPFAFGSAYALGGFTIAAGYVAALLVAWAAVSVWQGSNKVRLPR